MDGLRVGHWGLNGTEPACDRYRLARMRKQLATLLALWGLLVAPAFGTAAAQSASLPDIEDEVMCPTCGTALNQAFSPQAERQRDFIRAQIEQGRSKEEIKQALVGEFGPRVLATPRPMTRASTGPPTWSRSARSRRERSRSSWASGGGVRDRQRGPAEPAAELSADDAARLERDLSKYDV